MQIFDDPIPSLKRCVGREIARVIADTMTDDLVELLQTEPARISDLRHERFRRFSLERLLRYAHRLSRCAQITFASPSYPRRPT